MPLGASGVLGTAVLSAFKRSGSFEIIGLANSRPSNELFKLNLMDNDEVDRMFTEFKPDCALCHKNEVGRAEHFYWLPQG